ncbi:CtsR family transcriptional regulator [Caldalkalibacillus mannanilyticus]|uniref:CtsR family transcriptional regulator n=1 Tax=Caldalkalibacillus mannanilyticus TaxID=1418 RepID=UPI000469CB39|nr:CtsR family transcriptional regulator [Caldalkalibacillus mannanilyticus]
MRNISDVIENHLKLILEQSKSGFIVIQRSELADKFQCVPSQINYVINTRFTVEKGYVVESKRGGGGFIRIQKVQLIKNQEFMQMVLDMIEDEIPQATSEDIIDRLLEVGIVTEREARIMKSVIHRNILSFQIQIRDQLRSKLLKAMIISLMYK